MRCPGQDKRFWRPEDVVELACNRCGQTVEFFKDEGIRRCPACGGRVINPKVSLGCAQWCAHARDCLGSDPQNAPGGDSGQASLADRLVEAMKNEFGSDPKRITHALSVLDVAEQLLRQERADPRVVVAAAVLHDIGIQEAERKHGSSLGKFQELEGPPIAERILRSLGFDEEAVKRVCQIVAHHHRGDLDSIEFRLLWDADNLVNAREAGSGTGVEEVRLRLGQALMTNGGKRLAERMFGALSGAEGTVRPG